MTHLDSFAQLGFFDWSKQKGAVANLGHKNGLYCKNME